MDTAVFSAASLFLADDDSDDDGRRGNANPARFTPFASPPTPPPPRAPILADEPLSPFPPFPATEDETQVGAEGESQEQALEYEERIHKFPGVDLSIREFSCHQLNANLLWPGTFFFADWLVKNPSILDGQRILELGSGTGALAIFLRKTYGVDITTSDYDDKDIEENIAHNCRVNNLDQLPHIRHTWGDPFPFLRPDWNIVIASDILLYVKQYPNLITTLSFLLKYSDPNGQKGLCTSITTKSGVQVVARYPMFLMSWRRRIGKDQSIFFEGCEKAGLEVQHLGDLVYLISKKN